MSFTPGRSLPIVCLLLFSFLGKGYGQLPDSIAKKVDLIFSEWDKTNSPGCSIAIVKDGKIIYKRGYGMSNLEYNIAISPASIFHVASISKQFTAAAIQRLAMEGKLSLNDDIRKYVPEVPDLGHVITFNNLIHHTSGLRDQWDLQDLAGWRDDDLITENDVLEMLQRQRALNFLPGDEYVYCNTGFTILAVAVKKITGVSLREYADSVFFKPLGMTSTHFHSDHTEITVNRTSAYQNDGQGRWKISIPVFDTYGATSLFTTTEDLAKWDENFYTQQVGGSNFRTSMETPGVFNNGKLQNYASGLVIRQYKGNPTVEHSGADAGYRANILRFPQEHLSVIILANLANINPSSLSRKVADLFIRDKTAPEQPGTYSDKVDSAIVKQWAGDYMDFNSKAPVTLGYEKGKLANDGDPLMSQNDSTFIDPASGTKLQFRKDGAQTAFIMESTGLRDRTFTKVKKVTVAVPALAEYEGSFYSSELDVKYILSVKDSSLAVKTPRREPIKLAPSIKDYFTGPFTVEFLRNKKKQVTGFLLTTGRSRNLYFQKIAP